VKFRRWKIEPEWRNRKAVIIGGGPSLTREQVEVCRGRAHVIAVNTAYQMAPFADILYWSDREWASWWRDEPRFVNFAGRKVALENAATWEWDESVLVVQNYGDLGLCTIPDGVMTGRSSGYQAVNLAYHLGAWAILLLGFDMRAIGPNGQRTHWHMSHKRVTPAQDFERRMRPAFDTIKEPLARRGVRVINCTPGSTLECFERMSIEEAIALPDPKVRPGDVIRRHAVV
jgi:hypothetical protein